MVAACLSPEVGYRLVWQNLPEGLAGMQVAQPTAKALRDQRRRGAATPMRCLFEAVAWAARPADDTWCAIRTVLHGLLRRLQLHQDPDSLRNMARCGSGSRGGYPMVELMTPSRLAPEP